MKVKVCKWLGLLLAVCMLAAPVGAGLAEGEEDSATENSVEATEAPTKAPTAAPTEAPTEEPAQEPTEEPTEAPTDEPAATPEPDVPAETPEATDALEGDATPEASEQASPEPSESPMVNTMSLDESMPVDELVDGALQVDGEMTVEALRAALENHPEAAKIVVLSGGSINGEGIVGLPVENSGIINGGTFTAKVTNSDRISGGTFTGEVQNEQNGTISGGAFEGAVANSGTISGGTFSATVDNDKPADDDDDDDEEDSRPKGTITGGTFKESSTLNNYSSVSGAAVNGAINSYEGGEMTGCTFGESAKVANAKEDGRIEVKYTANGAEKTADYGTPALQTLEGIDSSKPWYWYKADATACTPVKSTDTFGLQTLNYTQSPKSKPAASPKPTATRKPSATPYSGAGNGVAASVEDEEEASLTDTLAEEFLADGDSTGVNIVRNGSNQDADYELLYIPAVPGEGALGAGQVPGEAAADGSAPAMLYVRAKGLGTEARTLSMTLSQLARLREEKEAEALLFRNGAATVSLNVSELFEGKLPKLMELMRAWAYNGANFDDYDLTLIDFDAIPVDPEFSEEELREFRLEVNVAPAVPVGYEIRVTLCLGDESKEIDPLLESVGIALHAQTVTDKVAVYYLDEAQERYLLETHSGAVPGGNAELSGYEVAFANGAATVLELDRSEAGDEYAGLCALAGRAGVYCIGVLPG